MLQTSDSTLAFPSHVMLRPVESNDILDDFALEPLESPSDLMEEEISEPLSRSESKFDEDEMSEQETSCKRSYGQFCCGSGGGIWKMSSSLSYVQKRPRKRAHF